MSNSTKRKLVKELPSQQTPAQPEEQKAPEDYACNWHTAANYIADLANAKRDACPEPTNIDEVMDKDMTVVVYANPPTEFVGWLTRQNNPWERAHRRAEMPVPPCSTLSQALAYVEGVKEGFKDVFTQYEDNNEVFTGYSVGHYIRRQGE